MFYQTQTAGRLPKGQKIRFFVPGDLDLDLQTRLYEGRRPPSEVGANPFSGSRDISYTNRKTTD